MQSCGMAARGSLAPPPSSQTASDGAENAAEANQWALVHRIASKCHAKVKYAPEYRDHVDLRTAVLEQLAPLWLPEVPGLTKTQLLKSVSATLAIQIFTVGFVEFTMPKCLTGDVAGGAVGSGDSGKTSAQLQNSLKTQNKATQTEDNTAVVWVPVQTTKSSQPMASARVDLTGGKPMASEHVDLAETSPKYRRPALMSSRASTGTHAGTDQGSLSGTLSRGASPGSKRTNSQSREDSNKRSKTCFSTGTDHGSLSTTISGAGGTGSKRTNSQGREDPSKRPIMAGSDDYEVVKDWSIFGDSPLASVKRTPARKRPDLMDLLDRNQPQTGPRLPRFKEDADGRT